MKTYEDETICIDEHGITVKNYFYPGHRRLVAWQSVHSATAIRLGVWTGRHRLVGIGFRRPRHFFHWDRKRSSKTHAIVLDTGRRFCTVLTPADHEQVLQIVQQQIADTVRS